MMILVRSLFTEKGPCDRPTAIQRIVRCLGYERSSDRLASAADNAITTAVRRGVLKNERGELSLEARRIEQYRRDFLKEQFLASLGRTWTEREEAIRAFARWLGFSRTGEKIENAARSIINGLLRAQRLEADEGNIRRQ